MNSLLSSKIPPWLEGHVIPLHWKRNTELQCIQLFLRWTDQIEERVPVYTFISVCLYLCVCVCAHNVCASTGAYLAYFICNQFLSWFHMERWNGGHFSPVSASIYWNLDRYCCFKSHLSIWHIVHISSMNVSWIFWGSNCNVRHNVYCRWHMIDVFGDLGLLCTSNIHLLPENWSFPIPHWLKSKKENKCAFWMYLICCWNNELMYCHVCFLRSIPKDKAQREKWHLNSFVFAPKVSFFKKLLEQIHHY